MYELLIKYGCQKFCHLEDGGINHMDTITGRNVGKTCRTHYKGTFNDGTQFDSSYDRGEPLASANFSLVPNDRSEQVALSLSAALACNATAAKPMHTLFLL